MEKEIQEATQKVIKSVARRRTLDEVIELLKQTKYKTVICKFSGEEEVCRYKDTVARLEAMKDG